MIINYWQQQAYQLGVKVASDRSASAFGLRGILHLVKDADGLESAAVSVPAGLVCGICDNLNEPGAELLKTGEQIDAYITVFDPGELAMLGSEKLAHDRGRAFDYSLGRLMCVEAEDKPIKAWVVRVHSPELKALRRNHDF